MRKGILFLFLVFVGMINVSAQFHREFNFSDNLHQSIDSVHRSYKEKMLMNVGIQHIAKVSQGRSHEFYNPLPGSHFHASILKAKTKKKWTFLFNPVLIKSFFNKSEIVSNQFPTSYPKDYWINHAQWLNRFDDKKSAINPSSFQFYPGISGVIHTKNKRVWGLGYHKILLGVAPDDGLLLSSNAPSFLKISYENAWGLTKNKNRTLGLKIFQGWLPSPRFDYESNGIYLAGKSLMVEKGNRSRWISGFDLRWKNDKGFEFGMNYINLMYWPGERLASLLPVESFFHWQKKRIALGHLGMGSIYAKYSIPEQGLFLWGELGTGNSSFTPISIFLRDTLLMGYAIGIQKNMPISAKRSLELFAQISSVQASTLHQAMSSTSWYVNSTVSQGYTHHGQVIGSGIGPGGASAYFSASVKTPVLSLGIFGERLMHNKDFFYANFYSSEGNFRRHWMDLTVGGFAKFKNTKTIQLIGLSFVKSFNHQWQIKDNAPSFFDGYGIDRSGFRLNYWIQLNHFKK